MGDGGEELLGDRVVGPGPPLGVGTVATADVDPQGDSVDPRHRRALGLDHRAQQPIRVDALGDQARPPVRVEEQIGRAHV